MCKTLYESKRYEEIKKMVTKAAGVLFMNLFKKAFHKKQCHN